MALAIVFHRLRLDPLRLGLRLLLLPLALATGCPSAATAPTVRPTEPGIPASRTGPAPSAGRLPSGVTPTEYELELRIDPAEDRFSGSVRIAARVDSPRTTIWLHGEGLDVTRAAVRVDGGRELEGRWQSADDGFASITLPSEVEGEIDVVVDWEAPFDTQLEGLYKVEHAGDDYAFTQMEPLAARKAFPCFDEPQLKTPFSVKVSARPGQVVIANAASTSVGDEQDGWVEHVFARTRPLPTYLIAFAVGPLDVVEADPLPPNGVRSRSLPLRGVAARGRGAELAYALEHTPALLTILEEYTGIEYPYGKLDLIAVPDFESGAMENAGAVTFRDSLLLIDEERSPVGLRRVFAYITAHELAHMWFGNLVTMRWWDDLWLNEAMATWMENRVVERWQASYEAEIEQVEVALSAMEADSLASARQVRQPIVTNHDIHNAFDWITYSKGAGVLAMFERWLGRETFQRGIRAYLDAHRFGAATMHDLIDALSTAAGRDVRAPFESFLTQPGVPELSMELVCEDGAPAAMTVTQRRYAPIGSSAETDRTWHVPVCLRHPDDDGVTTTCSLIDEAEGRVELGDDCPAWVMPNADGLGYYRWSLPAGQLEALRRDGLRHLSVAEKLSLADALEGGFASGRIQTDAVLDAMAVLAADDHHRVATAPIDVLTFVGQHLIEDDQRTRYEAAVRRMYQPHYRRLGWEARRGRPDDDAARLLRAQVIAALASLGRDPAVRREALRRARRYLGIGTDAEPDALSGDLLGTALSVAGEEADEATFDAMRTALSTTEDGQVRRQLLTALGSVRDDALAARARELSLSDGLRSNERMRPLGGQLLAESTREATWTWLREHFDDLAEKLPPTYAGWAPQMLTVFCDEAHADAVHAYFAPKIESLPGGPRNLEAAAEEIRLCAARVEAQRASARAWLAR